MEGDLMLKPVTKKMTDDSDVDNGIYRFVFYCDICGNPKQSVPYQTLLETGSHPGSRENEHIAAYERANREILSNFNRCPVCERIVCDDCFRIDESDMCFECLAKKKGEEKK
jgi:hypothetical protein